MSRLPAAAGAQSFLAGLPPMLGYRPGGLSTITLLDDTGKVLTTVIADHMEGQDAQSCAAALALAFAPDLPAAARVVAAAWDDGPTTSPLAAMREAHRLRRAIEAAAAELDPAPSVEVFSIAGNLAASASGLHHYEPLPGGADAFAAASLLLYGRPAPSPRDVVQILAPRPGPLRDAIADAMRHVHAVESALALPAPALWRRTAVRETMARLTDPQPWQGADAAAALLSLSDQRVLDAVVTATRAAAPNSLAAAPDPSLLTDLAVQAPPDLMEGPAAVLAAYRASIGHDSRPFAAAFAQLDVRGAIRGRSSATGALTVLADRPGVPRPGADDLPSFVAGRGAYPDPYAGGYEVESDPDPLLYSTDDAWYGGTAGPAR